MSSQPKGKIIDPFLMFGGLSFSIRGAEVYLPCPCPAHSNRDQYNAKFNMSTGEFIAFGLCKKTFGKGYHHLLSKWLRDECGIDSSVVWSDGAFLKKVEQKQETDWTELLKLPLALDNDYLISRGVTNSIVEQMDIRADDSMVVFPNTDINGKIVGVNTRYFGKSRKIRYIYHGERTPLFRMSDIMQYDTMKPLVIVEGVFGAIRGKTLGYQTSALLGTGGLKDPTIIHRFERVIFGLDRDEAGLIMAQKLVADKRFIAWLSEPSAYDELDAAGWDRVTNDITGSIFKYKEKWHQS